MQQHATKENEALTTPERIDRLRTEVARNPGDLDASLMLGSLLYQAGGYAESASAFEALLRHHPDHPQALLLLARTVARSERPMDALPILARAQHVDPENVLVWQVAAALASGGRHWLELLRIAQGWTQAHPDAHEAWQALSRAHFEESRFSDAIAAYQPILTLKPDDPSCLTGAARLAIAAQDYPQARDHLTRAQQIAPNDAELLYTLCRLHHLTGELDLAEQYCRRAIAARPGFATAYVELGALCEGRLSDAEISAIDTLFRDTRVHPEYRVMLGFTLGTALDRRNDFERAFSAWEEGNSINQGISEQEGFVYQPQLIESELALLPEIFKDLALALEQKQEQEQNLEPNKHEAAPLRPIFVVGMPRSGTTLIESILASHSQVHGAGELPTLYDIHEELMAVARHQGIDAARTLIRSQAKLWRQRYLDALPMVDNKTHVVDKQPLNFRSIGLIRLLFPESPIIYLQRQAMDVGFSIYRHKFSKSWPCAHRLNDIGHYYRIHEHIVSHWLHHQQASVHVVDYAELVRDPGPRIRELLSFSKLDFQNACLSPHKTRRPVATFSAVQVQNPVTTAYSGRFAHYTEWLGPLQQALKNKNGDGVNTF